MDLGKTTSWLIAQGSEVAIEFDLSPFRKYTDKVRVAVELTATGGTFTSLDFAVAWSGQDSQYAAFSTETALTQHTAVGAKIDELTRAGNFLRLTPTIAGTAGTATVSITIV